MIDYENRNYAYLSETMECAMGHDRVWWVTQCITGLVCESAKLPRLCNIRHYYELQFKNN
jgi:hypothetical protein